MLEIATAECNYKASLLEENLRVSHLWVSVEVEKGITILSLDLILPLLRLRHAIHVVFGGSDLQPLMAKELSLVEEIISGILEIPSTKEANALL